jgi:general stress protein 26
MPQMSLSDISEKMRDIDIAMLCTHTEGGAIAGRPMSNNREVDYDGDSTILHGKLRGWWLTSRMIQRSL